MDRFRDAAARRSVDFERYLLDAMARRRSADFERYNRDHEDAGRGWNIARVTMHGFGAFILLAATALMTAALFTHYWQIATLSQLALQQTYFGLYEICSAVGTQVFYDTHGANCAYLDFTERPYYMNGMYGMNAPIMNPMMGLNQGMIGQWPMGGLPVGYYGAQPMIGGFGGIPTNMGWNGVGGVPMFGGATGFTGAQGAAAYYPRGERWRLAVLILVALSCVFGLLGLVFSLIGIRARCSLICWAIFNGFCSLCSLIAIAIFKRYADDVTQRFVLTTIEVTEKFLGGSFYLASGATACFWISGILSIFVVCSAGNYLKSKHHEIAGFRPHPSEIACIEDAYYNHSPKRHQHAITFEELPSDY